MSSEPGNVHLFNVAPRNRTREAIAVVVTLAALFLLLFLFVGHSAAPHVLLHPHAPATHGAPSPH